MPHPVVGVVRAVARFGDGGLHQHHSCSGRTNSTGCCWCPAHGCAHPQETHQPAVGPHMNGRPYRHDARPLAFQLLLQVTRVAAGGGAQQPPGIPAGEEGNRINCCRPPTRAAAGMSGDGHAGNSLRSWLAGSRSTNEQACGTWPEAQLVALRRTPSACSLGTEAVSAHAGAVSGCSSSSPSKYFRMAACLTGSPR